MSRMIIDLNDFTMKVEFKIGDKIILQDNNRSYNSSYFNTNYYKYAKVVEVDFVKSKSDLKVSMSRYRVKYKNGEQGYFEQLLNDEFQAFRSVVRELTTEEFNWIVSYMKYLNHNVHISELETI